MSIQPVAAPKVSYPEPGSYCPACTTNRGRGDAARFDSSSQLPRQNSIDATLSSEYYSSQKLFVEYESKDGDKVTLNYEQVQYQKATMNVQADNLTDEQWQDIVKNIKDEFSSMRKDLLEKFIASIGGKVDDKEKDTSVGETDRSSQEIPGLPDFWNAENTSQRIVDFALSFRGVVSGTDEEYLNKVIAAVEEGFKQAKEMLGEMPDAVNNLVSDTYDLVMQKFDKWLQDRQIEQGSPVESEEAVAA